MRLLEKRKRNEAFIRKNEREKQNRENVLRTQVEEGLK